MTLHPLNTLYEVTTLAEAGWDAYNCLTPPISGLKSCRVFANTMFICAQICAYGSKNPKTCLTARVIANSADILKDLCPLSSSHSLDKKDYLRIIQKVALQIATLTANACILTPNLFGQDLYRIKKLSKKMEQATTTVGLVLNCYEIISSIRRQSQNTTNKADREYMEALSNLLEIQSIDQLEAIPIFFYHIEPFSLYICPISQKPIRHILVATDGKTSTYYEKTHVTHWLTQSPKKPPPNWPITLSLSIEHLQNCKEIQQAINLTLNSSIKELQNVKSFTSLKKFHSQKINSHNLNKLKKLARAFPLTFLAVLAKTLSFHRHKTEVV